MLEIKYGTLKNCHIITYFKLILNNKRRGFSADAGKHPKVEQSKWFIVFRKQLCILLTIYVHVHPKSVHRDV